ncbi:MAG: hypothetical protein EHM70_16390 [Chloroflexota bacterium]|nr:MAG: hypothetical protein EHM70_16390 [Chloroflexota bacterium]
MPLITRVYIKASLLYLVAALLAGILLAGSAAWGFPAWVGGLGPVYFHLFLVGWVTQLIFGVALWMFPKYSREKPRGSERAGWAIFALLNTGLLLRAVSEPAAGFRPGSGWGWALAVSAMLQWAAGMLFVLNTWGRVKER